MRKVVLIGVILGALLLSACNEQQQYDKTNGEVTSKNIVKDRFSDRYYVTVSYTMGENNKFSIDDCRVVKEVFDSLNIGDKVTVYANENGVGEILKNNEKLSFVNIEITLVVLGCILKI